MAWSRSEEVILQTHFRTIGAEGLLDMLPGRSLCSIKRKANRLRLQGPHAFPWRSDEDQILIDHYTTHGAQYVATVTGRSVEAVWHRAHHLRLLVKPPRKAASVKHAHRKPKKKRPSSRTVDPREIGKLGGRPVEYTLADLKAHASELGGLCLSSEYLGWRKAKHTWQCAIGHTWESTWEMIRRGGWCRRCQYIAALHAFAGEHDGVCLSSDFRGPGADYQWQCAKGHQWTATWVKQQHAAHWCSACSHHDRLRRNRKKRLLRCSIDELNAAAAIHGGRCLSRRFWGFYEKHAWQCRNGHKWKQSWHSVLERGFNCRHCKRLEAAPIESLHRMAATRGGKCLSSRSRGKYAKYSWQCQHGHQWRATWYSVNKGSWCKVCFDFARRLPFTIEDLQAHACGKGGLCVSSHYIHTSHKYAWVCEHHHTWDARWSSVQKGSWCPYCTLNRDEMPVENLSSYKSDG